MEKQGKIKTTESSKREKDPTEKTSDRTKHVRRNALYRAANTEGKIKR